MRVIVKVTSWRRRSILAIKAEEVRAWYNDYKNDSGYEIETSYNIYAYESH